MSTLGLDGVLSWTQAHHVAATCARPLPVTAARLDEAAGSMLAAPITLLADRPASDTAACEGYAICGEGPWRPTAEPALRPGDCAFVEAGAVLPQHTDAVLPVGQAITEAVDGVEVVMGRDGLSGLPDERARPPFGSDVIPQGAQGRAGDELVREGRVTPAMLALAAAAGCDEITIIRPPIVGTLVLGSSLLSSGLPRRGRVRDALGATVPAFVGRLGARGNPAVRAPDDKDLLLTEIDDADVDVLITTGSTAPGPDNHVRQVLRDLGARWLIDGVAVTPGAQMLLARLPDGRFLVGLPGDPRSALAGLVTVVAPLITAMRGEAQPEQPTAVLVDDAPAPEFADDTGLVPVRLEVTESATIARPLADDGPAGLGGWANADAVAVIPPGAGYRGDVVRVIRW